MKEPVQERNGSGRIQSLQGRMQRRVFPREPSQAWRQRRGLSSLNYPMVLKNPLMAMLNRYPRCRLREGRDPIMVDAGSDAIDKEENYAGRNEEDDHG
ncbi:hypothetical protein U1Q18_020250, partial [Sarracenia purpurea var. burkii]